jgi:hypothetical protein
MTAIDGLDPGENWIVVLSFNTSTQTITSYGDGRNNQARLLYESPVILTLEDTGIEVATFIK